METLLQILEHAPTVLGGMLMLVGSLKIFARYTKSEADDKLLAQIEKIISTVLSILRPKKTETEDEQK